MIFTHFLLKDSYGGLCPPTLPLGPVNYCLPSTGHVTWLLLCSKVRKQPPPTKAGSCSERHKQTKGNTGDVS